MGIKSLTQNLGEKMRHYLKIIVAGLLVVMVKIMIVTIYMYFKFKVDISCMDPVHILDNAKFKFKKGKTWKIFPVLVVGLVDNEVGEGGGVVRMSGVYYQHPEYVAQFHWPKSF